MVKDKSTPDTPANEYNVLMEELDLPHKLMGGTPAMREAGIIYLPQEAREDDKDYQARLRRSFLFGGYERTISIMSGEVFDKPVTLQEDTPQEFVDLSFNIDLQKRNLTRFSNDVFEWGLVNGTGHILIDTSPLPKSEDGTDISTTKDDDKKLGRRPYWIHVSATNLIEAKSDPQTGELIRVRIKEVVKEDNGEYGEAEIEQVRILKPGTWEIQRQDEKGNWSTYDSGKSPLDKIALVSFFTGRKAGGFTAKPPLTGLAELNHQHWVSSSDQNNILHVCRVPILFGKMLDVDDNGKITVSVNNLIHSQTPDGDLKYVENSGIAMGDGWKDVERIETLMSLWGLDLISNERSGNVTATEKAMTGAKTGSFLNACAQEYQDALNSAIELTCEMLKVDFDGGAVVNTDFSLALNSADSNVLADAFKIGLLDRNTVVDEYKRRGMLSENADAAEIALALENDARKTTSLGSVGSNIFT